MFTFDVTQPTELCEIMGKYGSDKGSKDITKSWHNYTTLYHHLFKDIQYHPLRIFELGIGSNDITVPSNMGSNGKPGASLFGWREYFVNSEIFGADIDKKILFSDDRIKTFYCDQTNMNVIKNMWNEPSLKEQFDIIIEDGLHTFEANVCFFENSIHKLSKKGFYIIEDIANVNISKFDKKINEWKIKYPNLTFKLILLKSTCNNCDNNLLVIY